MKSGRLLWALVGCAGLVWAAEDFPKPYSPPCTERDEVFEFTAKPAVKNLGNDRYEITFTVKAYCDVTMGIIDSTGLVVRHLGSGVLGANAPAPFQKGALRQTVVWNGKDDLDAYVKDPGRLRLQVRLGLKPEFERRLGVTNPKSIPGTAWGICADEGGVYLFYTTFGGYAGLDQRLRMFDHDGNYVRTLVPPPANLPPEKLQGLGFVEYQAGRKELQTPDLASTWSGEPAGCLPHGLLAPKACRPAISRGRLYTCTKPAPENRGPSLLHFIRTDGALEAEGVRGKPFLGVVMGVPYLAASPDGKWMYAAGDDVAHGVGGGGLCAVFRSSLEDGKPGGVFAGELRKPGSDNGHFNSIRGIDCDLQGRLYVCDHDNNRLQILAPDGRHAKTIALDRPVQVAVHRKSGAIYVLHTTRVQGQSVNRICKLSGYENPAVECSLDCPAGLMALDSWTAKPRIWLYGTAATMEGEFGVGGANVRILEEEGKAFRKVADFGEELAAEEARAAVKQPGGWSGTTRAGNGKMVCDPVREQAYFMNSQRFDLRTGAWLGSARMPGVTDDVAFDKRGYLHCHFNPGFYQQGVGRLDPSRPGGGPDKAFSPECPYDYGLEGKGGWQGILPLRDQPGAKFFQDGIGVNMSGDVAENCNIYYAPKRGDESLAFSLAGNNSNQATGQATDDDGNNYSAFLADIQRKLKTGEEVYWIRPKPGVPLLGATIWTFDRTGELRDECAVTVGGLINGVMLDEDGAVYFVTARTRLIGNRPFLAGQGGFFGAGKEATVTNPVTQLPGARQPDPFTGTLIKVKRKGTLLSTAAPIAMDDRPGRAPELCQYREEAWMEGAAWLYAGASPIVQGGCSCPTQRLHTDWYKRTFVPEAYRHSIGVLDSAGNLVLHIGQYGNIDSGYGPASKVPVGGDGLAFSDARMLSGTDNYLCFSDRGERIVVLKLKYHAEETVEIGAQQ